ncbi:unnamed protein product, partial [Meganyctiphanes norvegica]
TVLRSSSFNVLVVPMCTNGFTKVLFVSSMSSSIAEKFTGSFSSNTESSLLICMEIDDGIMVTIFSKSALSNSGASSPLINFSSLCVLIVLIFSILVVVDNVIA